MYFFYFNLTDEEIGGELGMEKFVKTEEFKKMNVACAIDEGIRQT